jgi:CHAT domain-containing protein/Tfp pilus assembly protein PilF
MFSLLAKAAFRRRTLTPIELCLLCLSLFIPSTINATPDLSPEGHKPLTLPLLVDSQSSGGKKNFGLLNPGETVRQEMGRDEAHVFQITLAAGQYLRVIVEQQRIDVALRILGPDGRSLIESDSPNGAIGPESASVIAPAAGGYTVEISSDKSGSVGHYEIKAEALREPTEAEINRVAAERLFAEGQSLRFKGTKESRELAIKKYEEALAIWKTLGDARAEAYTLCNIGRVFRALGDLTNSIDRLKRALLLLRDAQDVAGQAYMLNEMGATYRNLDDPLQALESYHQALELRRTIGYQWGQAQLLNNIGFIYWYVGYQRKAIENYEEALRLWREAQDFHNEANTLNNIGEAYAELGQLSYGLEILQRVLKFCQEVGDRRLEAYVLNNIGRLYEAWAEPETARKNYEAALNIFREMKNAAGEALVLDNIGMVHAGLGDTELALEKLKESYEIRKELKEPRGTSITLTNIGYVYAHQGNHQAALDYFNRALPYCRKAQNKPFIAYALVSAGMAYASLGELEKARAFYQQALEIQKEIDDRRGQAITLDRMGQAFALSGELTKALSSFEMALQNWLAIGDKQGEAQTLYGIAKLELDRNNLSESLAKIEEAIKIVESLRTKMLSQRLQTTYFATKQDFYALNIDVRMRLYDARRSEDDKVAALYVSEHARARNFLDLLSEARAGIQKGVAPELVEKSYRLEHEINSTAEGLMRLRNLKWTDKVVVTERRLDELINQYDGLQAKIRAGNKSDAELRQPELPGLKEIQQLLDSDTILLEYALGDRRSYLWIVTQTTIDSYPLPERAEIERAATTVRELLTAYEPREQGESGEQYLTRLNKSAAQYWQQAARLSRIVLAPVSAHPRAKRLVIVADGALQYIPFEALPIPGAPRQLKATSNTTTRAEETIPLVSRYEIVYEPSASALAKLRAAPQKQAAKSVAVLADPVFDSKDERVLTAKKKLMPDTLSSYKPRGLSQALRDTGDTGTQDGLERLIYSEVEANRIVEAAPARSWMKAVGFKANRATATSPELKQFAIIHFATHGILNDKHPQLSGLVLSLINEHGLTEDGFLRLHDIYNLDLPVDLIVLSACRTGIGRQVRGEGLISLTRGFMYAGAKKVLASLWRVDDEATAELMKRFYWHLLKEGMTAPMSLKLAQLEIMRTREQWRAPYYWAGFVLQGDWK